jgi:hypothetical protein
MILPMPVSADVLQNLRRGAPQGGGGSLLSSAEQFPYCDRNPAVAGLDQMPNLPIAIRHGSHSLSTVGLVDSGASISVLPYSLGVQLGFDWNSQTAHIILAGTLAHVGARHRHRGGGWATPAGAAGIGFGQLGSSPGSARTVELLRGVRRILFPDTWNFRDPATKRLEFAVVIQFASLATSAEIKEWQFGTLDSFAHSFSSRALMLFALGCSR